MNFIVCTKIEVIERGTDKKNSFSIVLCNKPKNNLIKKWRSFHFFKSIPGKLLFKSSFFEKLYFLRKSKFRNSSYKILVNVKQNNCEVFFKITPLQSFNQNHWKMYVKVNHFMNRDIIFQVICMDFKVMTILHLSWGISATVSFHKVKREEFKILKNSKYSRQAEILEEITLILKSRRFKKPNYFISFFQCILFDKADDPYLKCI